MKGYKNNFKESYYLGLVVYIIAIMIIFIIPIYVIKNIWIEIKYIMTSIASFIGIQSILICLFWKKYYLIWIKDVRFKKNKKKFIHG